MLLQRHYSILFYGWIVFHFIHVPHLLYPVICQWTLTCFGSCEQCCYEHSGAYIFLNYSFVRIYSQACIHTHTTHTPKAVFCHPAYLTYMQSTSFKTPGWMNLSVKSRFDRRNINNLRCADDTTLMAESEEDLKSLLMRVKEESAKAGLNLTFKKQRSWHLVPSFHGK